MERIVYEQIQNYFCTNYLNKTYQHAYRKGHSTATALTQMTDEQLKAIDSGLVSSVLLDLSAALGIPDHRLLVNKLHFYCFEMSSDQ